MASYFNTRTWQGLKVFLDQDGRKPFATTPCLIIRNYFCLCFSKLWSTLLLRHWNLLQFLPLLYHFRYWTKQRCHTFSIMGYCFFRPFTHCSTKTTEYQSNGHVTICLDCC